MRESARERIDFYDTCVNEAEPRIERDFDLTSLTDHEHESLRQAVKQITWRWLALRAGTLQRALTTLSVRTRSITLSTGDRAWRQCLLAQDRRVKRIADAIGIGGPDAPTRDCRRWLRQSPVGRSGERGRHMTHAAARAFIRRLDCRGEVVVPAQARTGRRLRNTLDFRLRASAG